MFELSKYERNICQFFVVRGYHVLQKKNNRVIKQRKDCINPFTRPHYVCHPRRTVFSSALVRTVAQVEKHCSKGLESLVISIKNI